MENSFHGFIKYPKEIFYGEEFSALSFEARTLLVLILDRTELSYKNRERFTDGDGEVFVYFTIREICEKLGCASGKAVKLLKQLEENGMIKKAGRLCGRPNKIVVLPQFLKFIKNEYYNSENQKDNIADIEKLTFRKSKTINTYNNNNDISNTDSSFFYDVTVEEIKEQIEYDCINGDAELVEEIVLIMADVLTLPAATVRIGGVDYPKEAVVKRFGLLRAEHIEEVIASLKKPQAEIRNMRNYLLTLLFNAPTVYAATDTAEIAYMVNKRNRINEN